MRTLEEIRRTPLGLLTEAEIAQTDPDFQDYARRYHKSREAARPGHERVETATPGDKAKWPDPTPAMLKTPEFEAVWQCIKHWDIGVPDQYGGYCGATGSHVRAILDALSQVR